MSADRPDPQELAERSRRNHASLARDYRALFTGDRGKRVLSDLHKKFSFGKWAAKDTHDTQVILRRVFMHGPLFEIADMCDKALGKPKNHHGKQDRKFDGPPV